MKTVLHYKTNFLNKSETFIHRLISNHREYQPKALCYSKRHFTKDIEVYQSPNSGVASLINKAAFHLNLPLPYYRSVIQSLKPDIIHAHFGYDGYKLLPIAQKETVPLVISFYGSDVSRLPGEFGWKARYKKMADSPAVFVAASNFMKKQLIQLGFPEDKIHIIRFGLDLKSLSYKEKNPEQNRFMMVGRFVEKKGFEYAIKSAQMVKQNGYSFTIDIYGDGPLKNSLADLVTKLNISDRIEFKGYRPMDEILRAHESHSLLIAPSVTAVDGDMEGLPNTILEAMAKGTPVIATNHAAIPEAVKKDETGYIVKERSPSEIANAMACFMIHDKGNETLRRNARSLIESDYSVEQMVQQTESLYNSLIS